MVFRFTSFLSFAVSMVLPGELRAPGNGPGLGSFRRS